MKLSSKLFIKENIMFKSFMKLIELLALYFSSKILYLHIREWLNKIKLKLFFENEFYLIFCGRFQPDIKYKNIIWKFWNKFCCCSFSWLMNAIVWEAFIAGLGPKHKFVEWNETTKNLFGKKPTTNGKKSKSKL